MAMTVHAVEDFLTGKGVKVQQRARTMGKKEEQQLINSNAGAQGQHTDDTNAGDTEGNVRKVGDEGELVFHPVADNTASSR